MAQGGGTQPEKITEALRFIKDYIKIYNSMNNGVELK